MHSSGVSSMTGRSMAISVGTGEGSLAGWEENGSVVSRVSRVRLGQISGGIVGVKG